MDITSFSKLDLSSEHQYVLVDPNIATVVSAPLSKIAMSFAIYYYGEKDNPPVLTFLINPQNISFSFSKKINPSFARGGYIVEEWGEMQDTISCAGKIGGYYVKTPNSDFPGLNRYDRTKSESFRNLYSLLLIYRNNGAIYQRTTTTKVNKTDKLIKNANIETTYRVPASIESQKNRIDKLGDLFLIYDDTFYLGAFDNFMIEEDSGSPYNLNYSFTFTVQHRSVLDHRDFYYYNQVFSDNSDITKNQNNIKEVLQKALNVESRAKKDESFEAMKAAGVINSGTINFKSNLSEEDRKNIILDTAVNEANRNGLKTDEAYVAELKLFYEAQTETYEQAQQLDQNIKNLNLEAGKDTIPDKTVLEEKAENTTKAQSGLLGKYKLNS